MVLERDQEAIDFISKFRICSTKHVAEVSYNGNQTICAKRLKKLTDDKLLHRIKNPYGLGYLYSVNAIKSTKQLRHTLLRDDFHIRLLEMGCEILRVDVECDWGRVRPDAFYILKYEGKSYTFLLEVETAKNTINTAKYNDFWLDEYKRYLKVPITVVYITDKPVKHSRYDYKVVDLKLESILNIFDRE